MWNKIKKFLEDRGWYKIPEEVRHIGGSAALVLFSAGVTQMVTGEAIWPLAGLAAWLMGLGKELGEAKGAAGFSFRDMNLNTLGVLLGMLPWILSVAV